MLIRLTAELATKIKVTPQPALPLAANPFTDWSARLFRVGRMQYILVTNTLSLYSILMPSKGSTSGDSFMRNLIKRIEEFMCVDGLEAICKENIAPSTNSVTFTKALNRSITGTMNDIEFAAQIYLAEREDSLDDASLWINESLHASLGLLNPREALQNMGTKG